ncbi:hypothetical protein HDR62_05205 [bacterium]|nr:hypothetical protein [bacterium]
MKKYWKVALFALPFVLLLAVGCKKEEEYVYPDSEPYEKTLWFDASTDNGADSISPKIIRYFANDPACMHIYLTLIPNSRNDYISTATITTIRKNLQKRVEISPKVSGRGDWWFRRGKALPADSLWFVQNGWTVNQIEH